MKWIILILFSFISFLSWSQEKVQSFFVSGYLKNLHSSIFFKNHPKAWNSNMIHHRLNTDWIISDNISSKIDLRNRLFYMTDEIFLLGFDPNEGNDWVTLGGNIFTSKKYLLHSAIDRLYLDFSFNDWEVRVGRQRVNWGIGTFWNPNDIFNAFSFLDFDYEERPGMDGVRVTKYGKSSTWEFAINGFNSWDNAKTAIKFNSNIGTYDIQFLTGFSENYFVLGTGWAGNLKDAGFKGEVSLFNSMDTKDKWSISASIQYDYQFKSGLFWSTGYLLSSASPQNVEISNLFDFEISARTLYIYKHTLSTTFATSFHPLINGSFSILYSPSSTHPIYVGPAITYSIFENWDLDLVGQLFFQEKEKIESPYQILFLRLKYSY
jgi:hypothetical protein